jgi:hypothetical protein
VNRPVAAAAATILVIAGCGGDPATTAPTSSVAAANSVAPVVESVVIDPGDGGTYAVDIDPSRFTSAVDNPYLPKLPGMTWEYLSMTSAGELETITIEVLDERRTVMGVETIVVHDIVTDADGVVIEDTYDWFAQDADGNVWYFGEDTTSYTDGVASQAGAWEAGVDGALPGIVMPAAPLVSNTGYRQEYRVGEAEDMGQIVELGLAVDVPAGSFTDVVRTKDWTPLEPEVVEHKAYAPGVGWIQEAKIEPDGVFTIAVLTAYAG